MANKKERGPVTGNMDSEIKKAQQNDVSSMPHMASGNSIMAAGMLNNELFRNSVKNNPFFNMFGVIPQEAMDHFITAMAESFNAGNAMVPEPVTTYFRSAVKTSAHHAIKANRHVMSGMSKVLDNMEHTIKSF